MKKKHLFKNNSNHFYFLENNSYMNEKTNTQKYNFIKFCVLF